MMLEKINQDTKMAKELAAGEAEGASAPIMATFTIVAAPVGVTIVGVGAAYLTGKIAGK
ncbi:MULTISPECIES: hypothetical protein [Streptomyces]|uniref:hypothetical protein n=1 Tax=Streptomyces TaxID=1883 RepID=UPI000241B7BB|nr:MULTISPECIES: hypothetical protein [Streptomyces]EHM28129.1 hypothetical protein SPW_3478 [Streptomyces sp. W007]WSI78213.1 hypothetical protein OG557_15220 [Streptomyces anulatus]WSU74211.1 hypothetical protein OG499_15190 [Streptomyces anulatus]WTD10472.1 hypothetical protein OHA54_15015 [Streptomyces anulatus]WTD27435.1 hypothetical protein OH737_24245 [Streptomyces anulatus]